MSNENKQPDAREMNRYLVAQDDPNREAILNAHDVVVKNGGYSIGIVGAMLEAARATTPSPVAASAGQAPIKLSAAVREYLQEGISNCSPGEVEGDYEFVQQLGTLLAPIYAAPTAPSLTTDAGAVLHSDDVAVDAFAAAMKEKLAQARAKGRGGWKQCDPSALSIMLREHVEKGDPRDVANFCAFLWNLNQPIAPTEQRMSDAAPFADDAERAMFLQTMEEFDDCNETATDDRLLMKWANAGLLECNNYLVTEKGQTVRDAARKGASE